ncbi:MAG: flagellar protein FlgN [Pseudomonadota bacterium]
MASDNRALTDEGHLSPDAFAKECERTARALLDVLQKERVALAGVPTPGLQELFDRKAELADALDRLESVRRERWPGDPDVLVRALSADAATCWTNYVKLLADCRETNAISGRLVQARQRNVREAIAVLRGTSDDSTATYDATGSRPEGLDPLTLGSA